jgi:acid phosphatase (class A)
MNELPISEQPNTVLAKLEDTRQMNASYAQKQMTGRPAWVGFLAALVIFSATLVSADNRKGTPYLAPDSVDAMALLPPPPAEGSDEARAELDLVVRLGDARTPREIAQAKSEKTLTVFAFAGSIGPWFTPEKLPHLASLFKEIDAETTLPVGVAKRDFRRPRPSAVDARVKPLFGDHDGSYPSGHSVHATVDALVLSELLPDLRVKLLSRAQEIGWDRVIAGMHRPSDIYAGRVMGQSLARAILANAAFRAELEQLRSELDAARQSESAVLPGN